MSNRQIQPVRNNYPLARQARPRGLVGQVWALALQPNYFFSTLPQVGDARQWFIVAVLILALNGFAAVRQEALAGGAGADAGGGAAIPGDLGGLPGDPFQSGGGPGGFDPGILAPQPQAPAASGDIASTWVTALISGSHIILGWLILMVLLGLVPMFNGRRPNFGQNLQIAIWTSVPFGLMAGLQLIFYAAGGTVGAQGIAGLLTFWQPYQDMATFGQSLLLSLASRLTVFWVWSLALVFIGARSALQGKVWAVLIVVVVWALILVVAPVLTGAIAAPPKPEAEVLPTEIPLDVPPEALDPFATPEAEDVLPTLIVLPTADVGTAPPMGDAPVTNDQAIPTAGS